MTFAMFGRELVLGFLLLLSFGAIGVFGAPAAASTRSLGQTTVSLQSPMEQFKSDLSRQVRQQLATQMRMSLSDFQVDFENLHVSPELPKAEKYSMQVLGLGSMGAKRLDGLFSLTVIVNSAQLNNAELQVNGVMKVIGPVPVAKSNLTRGRILEAGDLEMKILPWKTFPTGAVGNPVAEMSGRHIRSFVNAGDLVWSGVLEEAYAVRSGDAVELTIFSGPGVIIKARGVARQEGRLGESIRIEQPDTKKLITALVVGNKSVELRF